MFILMNRINSLYIIDDDPITIFGIRKMLKIIVECNDIRAFGNGKEALDDLKERMEHGVSVPEVLFLDINMPIMDGWEFLEELLKLNIEERLIINVVTSSIDPIDYQKWNYFRLSSPHHLNFRNKPIYKIEASDVCPT